MELGYPDFDHGWLTVFDFGIGNTAINGSPKHWPGKISRLQSSASMRRMCA